MNTRRPLVLVAAVCTVLTALPACQRQEEPLPAPQTTTHAATPPAETFGISLGGANPGNALGAEVFAKACAECHGGTGHSRAPAYSSLSGMSPSAIVSALESGLMREQGSKLSADERRAVAEWLTGHAWTPASIPESAFCDDAKRGSATSPVLWSGWGGDMAGSGARSAEQAGFTAADVPHLELAWAFGFTDAVQARSKPAVAGDRLVVGSQSGEVYSLDVASGCIHWMFQADAAVRGGIVVDEARAWFVDFRANVYAIDLEAGRLAWKRNAGDHPEASNTGTPALHAGRLYVPLSTMEGATAMNPAHPCCTTSGEVVSMSADDGRIVWRHRVAGGDAQQVGVNAAGTPIFAPSGAPVWSSPTIDVARGRVYVGTGENFTRPATTTSDSVLALDMESGAFVWAHQGTADDAWNLACGSPHPENCPLPLGPDVDFGMAPIVVTRADDVQILVAGQKSGNVWALDPQRDGAVLWKTKVGKGSTFGGIHWGMASDGRRVYVPVSDSPAGMQGIEPDFPASPGLHALDLADGKVVWSAPAPAAACEGRKGCVPAHSAAPTVAGDVVFSGSLDGHLRAYSTRDGAVLWDFDTVQEFETVNDVPARGGAIDGPGPVVTRGMVFALSGYGLFGQMPGNVLLAFAVARD